MVHESCWAANVHAIAHVEIWDIFRVEPHLLAVLAVGYPVAVLNLFGIPRYFFGEVSKEVTLSDRFRLCELVKVHKVITLVG